MATKNKTALESVLKPDFSDYMKDGKLDTLDAFESHINQSKLLLSAAMAILESSDDGSGALTFLECLDVSLSRGIEEAYRIKRSVKAA